MPHPLKRRASSLASRLRSGQASRAIEPLLARFRGTGPERTIAWFATSLVFALLISVLLATAYYGSRAVRKAPPQRGLCRAVGDERWKDDYSRFPATGWEFMDDGGANVIVASDGGGAFHGRTDALPLGIWETFSRRRTDGVIAEDSLKQVHFDGTRLWFVGKRGSLASCNGAFGDWKQHLSGAGFTPGLDLAKEVTHMAASPGKTIIAVGTRRSGLGVYDTVGRGWLRFDTSNGQLRSEHVTALLLTGRWLFAGTDKGLTVFGVSRRRGVVRVERASDREIPEPFRDSAVRTLSASNGGDRRVFCAVGHGALLETSLERGEWRVLLGEGDDKLPDRGALSASSLVEADAGTWLAIPGYGFAFYDHSSRHIGLSNERMACRAGTRVEPAALASDGGRQIWAVSSVDKGRERHLYQRSGDGWDQVSLPGEDVEQLVLAGGSPVFKMGGGRVKVLGPSASSGKGASVLFVRAPFPPPFQASDVGAGQLFVAESAKPGSGSRVARYVPATRSWQPFGPADDRRVAQLRVGDDALWAVMSGGELGYFAPLNTTNPPAYTPVFGPSALPRSPSVILTAETLEGGLWFVRPSNSIRRIYVYDPTSRTIVERSDGLPADIRPYRLRAVGHMLYLWGAQLGHGVVYAITPSEPKAKWKLEESADVVQMASSTLGLACRMADGRVTARAPGSKAVELFGGTGAERFGRLVADRFGRLWGAAGDGRLLVYEPVSGCWHRMLDRGCTDVAVVRGNTRRDTVYVATTSGLHAWNSEPAKASGAGGPDLGDAAVAQVDSDDDTVVALAENGSHSRGIWKCRAGKDSWIQVWETTVDRAPSVSDWSRVAWADFIGDRLCVVTRGERLHIYGLVQPVWSSVRLAGGATGFQVSRDGVLWYLDGSGTLHALDPASRDDLTFDGTPDYTTWWSIASQAATWIAAVTAAIAALLVGLPLALTALAWGLFILGFMFAEILRYEVSAPRLVVPPWRPAAILALCAAAVFVLHLAVEAVFIAPRRPFVGAYFAGCVTDFGIEGRRLIVHTGQDTWLFRCRNTRWSPLRFYPGRHLPLPDREIAYPRTDDSGRWLLRDDRDLQVLRRDESRDYRPLTPSDSGFVEDDVRSIAILGSTLLATTPNGLANYGVKGDRLELLAYHGVDGDRAGMLRRHGSEVLYWTSDGQAYRCDQDTTDPLEAEYASSSVSMHSGAVWWASDGSGDSLLRPGFDAAKGRFVWDVCRSVAKDRSGGLWARTLGGWRCIRTGGGVALLDKPTQKAPRLAPPMERFAASANWTCLRNSSHPTSDSVRFSLAGGGLEPQNDPFGNLGRWPDEYAQCVLPSSGSVYVGTRGGVAELEPRGGSLELALAGTGVTHLEHHQDSVYCRASGASYQLGGGTWRQASSVPTGMFASTRKLSLPIGRGITVSAVETAGNGGRTTTCLDFDASQRRFRSDIVTSIFGDSTSLYVTTPAGLQRMTVRGSTLADQSAELPGRHVTALRAGSEQGTCALADGSAWRRDSSGSWSPAGKANPFSQPIRGTVGPLIGWQRRFRPSGDTYELSTAGGPPEFRDGKLLTDWAMSAASAGKTTWQATPLGVVETTGDGQMRLIPWPAGGRSRPASIAASNGRLVCHIEDRDYGLGPDGRHWSRTRTSKFLPLNARFNGLEWDFPKTPSRKPKIELRLGKDITWPARLNDLGQFPFDCVRSVSSRETQNGKRTFTAHGTGVTVYDAGGGKGRPCSYLHATDYPTWLSQEVEAQLAEDSNGGLWLALASVSGALADYRILNLHGTSFRQVSPREAKRNPFEQMPSCVADWRGNRISIALREDRRSLLVGSAASGSRVVDLHREVLDIRARHGKLLLLTPKGLAWLDLRRIAEMNGRGAQRTPAPADVTHLKATELVSSTGPIPRSTR